MAAPRAPHQRPDSLRAVVHGEIRAHEFWEDLRRAAGKRPRRLVVDLSRATVAEAGALVAVRALEWSLAGSGCELVVIAGEPLRSQLESVGAGHLIHAGEDAGAGRRPRA